MTECDDSQPALPYLAACSPPAGPASTSVTRRPARSASMALTAPTMPAPMMTTWRVMAGGRKCMEQRGRCPGGLAGGQKRGPSGAPESDRASYHLLNTSLCNTLNSDRYSARDAQGADA